jgi:two-component system CheB/CheR fusion protein
MLLVSFEEADAPADLTMRAGSPDPTWPNSRRSCRSGATSCARTIEHYEASSEELKASNEELQAINEELRSATEELETSKEELQSTNEELTPSTAS